jgi:hypothetical protein
MQISGQIQALAVFITAGMDSAAEIKICLCRERNPCRLASGLGSVLCYFFQL